MWRRAPERERESLSERGNCYLLLQEIHVYTIECARLDCFGAYTIANRRWALFSRAAQATPPGSAESLWSAEGVKFVNKRKWFR